MAELGVLDTTNVGGTAGDAGVLYGSVIPDEANTTGGTISKVSVAIRDTGSLDDYQIGIAVGGTNTSPEGATLIWDSGTQDGDPAGTTHDWMEHDELEVEFPPNVPIWCLFVSQGSSPAILAADEEFGDFTAMVYAVVLHTVGDPLPEEIGGASAVTTRPLKFRIEYTPAEVQGVQLQHAPAEIVIEGQQHMLAMPTKIAMDEPIRRRSDGELIAARDDLEYAFWLKSDWVENIDGTLPAPVFQGNDGETDSEGNWVEIDTTGVLSYGAELIGGVRVPGGSEEDDLYDLNEFTVT